MSTVLVDRRAFLRTALEAASGFALAGAMPRRVPALAAATERRDVRATRLAVSLTLLAQRAARAGGRLPPEVVSLGGLTRVGGYLVEPNGEIILFGETGTATALHVDDIVVAIRNRYAGANHPVYHTAPGCTIDPMPGVEDPWALQEAKLLGLPPCRMGQRMIAHDYELKRIGAGIATHGSIPSSFEMTRQALARCSGTAPGRGQSIVHRFWFVPRYDQAPRFTVAQQSVVIDRPVGIQLLTEQEFLRNGERVGSAAATPLATRWAEHVTVALARGTYAADMTGDFRLIELATVFSFLRVPAESLRYWLSTHALEQARVPRFLGGVRREEQGEMLCENSVVETRTRDGVSVSTSERMAQYRLEYRGGVDADVRMASGHIVADRQGRVDLIAARIRAARPLATTAVWSFQA